MLCQLTCVFHPLLRKWFVMTFKMMTDDPIGRVVEVTGHTITLRNDSDLRLPAGTNPRFLLGLSLSSVDSGLSFGWTSSQEV
jgi:hypothetical protein